MKTQLPLCTFCKSANIQRLVGVWQCLDCQETFSAPLIDQDPKPRKHGKTLATQRTLRHFEKNGWMCAIVEKWLPPRGKMKFGVRKDVWAFGDVLVCRAPVENVCKNCFGSGKSSTVKGDPCTDCQGRGMTQMIPGRTALVQCFPDSGFSEHRAKVLSLPQAKLWLLSGNKIFLNGWRFGGARGERKGWILREEEITLKHFVGQSSTGKNNDRKENS